MHRPSVLVVDDSAVARTMVSNIVATHPRLELVGAVASGEAALEAIVTEDPDVLILDVEMPGMDGIEVLDAMRARDLDTPVFMFSSATPDSARATLDALARGAIDFVAKPDRTWSAAEAREHIEANLIAKIVAFFADHRREASPHGDPATTDTELVVMGCSTGGPNALAALLPQLPADLPVPLVIVQHMPPVFTAHLARRLDALCALTVREAVEGAVLRPGDVWIAPGDRHTFVERTADGLELRLDESEPIRSCRPSVDKLFLSAAAHVGRNTLAVVMTGMGYDGLDGSRAIHDAGGTVVVQDHASAVVWSMAGAVARDGIADDIVPLSQMADAIESRLGKTLHGGRS